MMVSQHVRRCREFTGPSPHSVAIKAKPTRKIPVEHLILEGRRRDELRDEALSEKKYQKMCDLKSEWEKSTDKRIERNTITRRVERLMQREQFSLEDRREKLRELLLQEEEDNIKEMEAKEETTLERQAKMRARAKFLKEKREKERLQFVEEKLDQRWRGECEELRATLSRRHQDSVFQERESQIKIKDTLKKRDQEVEKMYADMWETDRQLKAQREEDEANSQLERNRETLRVLQLQTAANAETKEQEKKLKELEAQWLKEEARIRAEEEEMLKQEKKKKQNAAKRAREISIRLKNQKEAKDKQEEIAMEMKILEKLLEDTRNEAMEESQRKRELQEENLRFMQYCKTNRQDQEDREKLLERLVNEEVEKQWAKKMEQYRIEREARRRLMSNVLKSREQQIEERKRMKAMEEEADRKEREQMRAAIEEHKRLEMENQERIKQRNLGLQRDLEMQIDYQGRLKDKQREEEREEFLLGMDAEAEYQRKLKSALARPQVDKVHPIRLMVTGSRTKSA